MKSDQFSEYKDSSPDKAPITEDGSPEGQGDSIHIPAEFLEGAKFKEGDELVLKVISADEDGVEVEYAKEAGGADENAEGEGSSDGPSANDEIDQMGANQMGGGY